jgi:hypothetical protein
MFATLTAPIDKTQASEVAIVDSLGKNVWSEMAWNATMAIAPDGSFVALSTAGTRPEYRAPPVPEFTSDLWLRDKFGSSLAHRSFNGRVAGVSSDSRCVLVQTETDLVGMNRELQEVWRIRDAKSPQFEGNVILENLGNSLRASRMPICK